MYKTVALTVFLFIQIAFGNVIQPVLKPTFNTESRIVGGQDARPGQFPHQVSLRTTFDFHFCGASILNSRWILTAGHCTEGNRASDIFAVVGAHTLSSGGIKHKCSKIVNHPEYNDFNLINDVAVIKTATPISIGRANVQPIPLINRFVDSGVLHVSGWGATSNEGSSPNTLQWLTTYVVPQAECKSLMQINKDTLCAKVSAGHGVCFGDSGGPLILPGEGQVGINSFVMGGCALGYPDGFSSVYYHRSWIVKQTSN